MDRSTNGLTKILPRFLRIIQEANEEEIQKLISESNGLLRRLEWCPDFLAFPGDLSLSQMFSNNKFRLKKLGIFPMDLSSSLAVYILFDIQLSTGIKNIKRDKSRALKVLDLCCCPGAKLQMISEVLSSNSSVVGVDISSPRLDVCMSLLRSYHSSFASSNYARQLIFHSDGRSFGCPEEESLQGRVVFDSFYFLSELKRFSGRKHRNKSMKRRENTHLESIQKEFINFLGLNLDSKPGPEPGSESVSKKRHEPDQETPPSPYPSKEPLNGTVFDYVLVDAECTHDASYRHMDFVHDSIDTHIDELNPTCQFIPNLPHASVNSSQNKRPKLIKKDATLSHHQPKLSAFNVPPHQKDDIIKESIEFDRHSLRELQRGLLLNGFRRLAPGGVLVYSTCSKDEEQNERVIQWLLDSFPDTAKLVPIDFSKDPNHPSPTASITSATRTQPLGFDEEWNDSLGVFEPFTAHTNSVDSFIQSISMSPKEQVSSIAQSLLASIAERATPPINLNNHRLPGTLRVDYLSGMSGHFIAKIQKIS